MKDDAQGWRSVVGGAAAGAAARSPGSRRKGRQCTSACCARGSSLVHQQTLTSAIGAVLGAGTQRGRTHTTPALKTLTVQLARHAPKQMP